MYIVYYVGNYNIHVIGYDLCSNYKVLNIYICIHKIQNTKYKIQNTTNRVYKNILSFNFNIRDLHLSCYIFNNLFL